MKYNTSTVEYKLTTALRWYGDEYKFMRQNLNDYGEPEGDLVVTQIITGLYHSAYKSFLDLISIDSSSVKSKYNSGITCLYRPDLDIKQGDQVTCHLTDYRVTAVEPIIYGSCVVAVNISLDEVVR